jgi:two-component system cell cycle sensor histidine kinase/response regulator CckA
VAELGGQRLVFSVCHDVTERKRAVEALREREEIYSNIVGQAMDAIALVDGATGRFVEFNTAAHEQLGYTREEFAGLSIRDIQADHSPREIAANLDLIRTQGTLAFESRHRRRDGALRDAHVRIRHLRVRKIGEQVRLSFDGFTGALPAVSADAGMLEQVLVNLVVNARDAMPRGGTVTLATGVLSVDEAEARLNANRKPGRFVRLEVSDNGEGMDRETQERLFEPFFTTKEPGKGTGLGLATVHGIVAQHQGWIEVESEVGRGATVRVFLPALAGAPIPEPAPPPPEPVRRGSEGILLVEDESQLRRMIALNLRSLGYRVWEAGNGQEALQVWREHAAGIDLLFTDMVMPEGVTGLELATLLRAGKPSLKVVLSSGYSSEIVEAGGVQQAGMRYLAKPYQARVLATTIRACLDEPPRPVSG